MRTRNRIRFGLFLAILVVAAIGLRGPGGVFAQDEQATPGAVDAVQDEAPTPPLDTTPPSIDQPADITVAAVDASGAVVEFAIPAANDDVDGSVAVGCAPGSGSVFPLGQTVVTCSAGDAAGNVGETSFTVTVTDQTPPQIDAAADLAVDAGDASGVAVDFAVPAASDNVDGAVAVGCDWTPGAVFPVGTTVVTCSAQDAAGNVASPVSFAVTVNPPPAPTDEPAATATPAPAETASPTEDATETPSDDPGISATPIPSDEPAKPSEEPTKEPSTAMTATPTPRADGETAGPRTGPTPEALPVDEALLGSFTIVTDGGPLDVLTSIWGGLDFPISQEFGHTDFSVTHHSWYAYGADYGLDGYEHPGIDIGMPRGTALYAPVDGVVKIAGGVPFYTFYGNGQPGVGELLIETKDGNEVILGHMGRIVVDAGQEVHAGQFVGLSGGDNGDHLHLEARERQPLGGYLIVDPRTSFLVPALKAEATRAKTPAKHAKAADAAPAADTGETSTDQAGAETLSQPSANVGTVAGQRSDKYAKITIVRVNCAVGADGSGMAACGDDVLAGSEFTVYNPTHHGRTRVTGVDGQVSFGPRAGENTITKTVDDGFTGAYVSCVDQDTGRVLFQGAITDPSVTLQTEAGEHIVCTWYNLAS